MRSSNVSWQIENQTYLKEERKFISFLSRPGCSLFAAPQFSYFRYPFLLKKRFHLVERRIWDPVKHIPGPNKDQFKGRSPSLGVWVCMAPKLDVNNQKKININSWTCYLTNLFYTFLSVKVDLHYRIYCTQLNISCSSINLTNGSDINITTLKYLAPFFQTVD